MIISTSVASQKYFQKAKKQSDYASALLSKNSDSVAIVIDSVFTIINKAQQTANKDYSDSLQKLKVRAFLIKGIHLKDKQDFHSAFKNYTQALQLAKELKDDYLSVMALNNIAIIYNELGELDLRNHYFSKALDLSKEMNNYYLEKQISFNMALFFIEEKKYQKGLEFYQPTYIKAKEKKDSLFIAAYWTLKSNIAFEQNELNKGIKYGEMCLQYCSNSTNNYFYYTTEIDLANAYLKNNTISKAKKLIVNFQNYGLDHYDRLTLERLKVTANYFKAINQSDQHDATLTRYYAIKDSLKIEEEYAKTVKEGLLKKFNEEKRLDSIQQLEKDKNLIQHYESKQKSTHKNWLFIIVLSSLLFIILTAIILIRYKRSKNTIKLISEEKKILAQDHKKLKEKLSEIKALNKPKKAQYSYSSLDDEKRKKILAQIQDYMSNEEPYLDPSYSLEQLSNDTKITKHHISEVLNVTYGKNFYEFMNIHRIEKAKKIMIQNTNGELKLLAICFDSGFNSRATFNRVFKNMTSQTPSEFQKKHLNS